MNMFSAIKKVHFANDLTILYPFMKEYHDVYRKQLCQDRYVNNNFIIRQEETRVDMIKHNLDKRRHYY